MRQVLDHVLRTAAELSSQVFALSGDAGRTCVQVALARHVAAQRHHDPGSKAELLGAQQRGDHDVAAVLEAAVSSQRDSLAEPVGDQHLLRLRQPELPGDARILYRRQR